MTIPHPLESADPRIQQFVRALGTLSHAQWATICGRYAGDYERIAHASAIAVGELAGIGGALGDTFRAQRLDGVSRLYSACMIVTADLPETVTMSGVPFPLRALAKIATVDGVRALLVREAFEASPALRDTLHILLAPFEGIVTLPRFSGSIEPSLPLSPLEQRTGEHPVS